MIKKAAIDMSKTRVTQFENWSIAYIFKSCSSTARWKPRPMMTQSKISKTVSIMNRNVKSMFVWCVSHRWTWHLPQNLRHDREWSCVFSVISPFLCLHLRIKETRIVMSTFNRMRAIKRTIEPMFAIMFLSSYPSLSNLILYGFVSVICMSLAKSG